MSAETKWYRFVGRAMAMLVLSGAAWAEGGILSTYNPHDIANPNIEEHKWSELKVQLPPFPQDADLIEAELEIVRSRFRYFIDSKNLVSNPDDGTIQYTLVMQSDSGARNVMFESMRCDTQEHKTYAYGDSKGQWRPMANPKWRPFRMVGTHPYHYRLWNYYLCSMYPQHHLSSDEIIRILNSTGRDFAEERERLH